MRRRKGQRGGKRYDRLRVAVCVACLTAALPATADQSVTLVQRQFASTSPAAPFEAFVTEARRLAATTTPAWKSAGGDLAAWGPALIFPLLDVNVGTSTVADLAAPLEAEGTAPVLMFRTLGLYAAKSRVPFADTPALQGAVRRNLRTIERATRDLERFAGGPGLEGWGSIGAGAWLAYLELLYPQYWDLGDPGAERWGRDGLRIVEQLLVRGVLPDGKGFRRDPRDEQLTLWPSVLAIYALVTAYENEAVVRYETAAVAAAAAVEALRADDGSYYADTARERKDARANAYCAGALLLLFKNTGAPQYRERAMGIVRWLASGAGAAAVAQDAALAAHVAYLALLADSLAMQPFDHLLGRRPMRGASAGGAGQGKAIAARLRPADFRYREMFDAVLRTLVERVPQTAGDIAYDHGDAPGYATEVLLAGGAAALATPIIARAQGLAAWPQPRHLDEIAFGSRALLVAAGHPDVADAGAAKHALRRSLLWMRAAAFVDGDYFDWLDRLAGQHAPAGGPTANGAQAAELYLRYSERFHDEPLLGFLHNMESGRSLLAGAERAAWDTDRHSYRVRPGSDTVALLPNAMMIIALVDAQRVTGEVSYLTRATEVARAVDGLWDDERGAYFASSEEMGDHAYFSLSTNTYAALALLRLSQATQQGAYRERAVRVFDFIRRDLYSGGVIYPHLSRGRRPGGDVWCSGCNWRVLHALVELAAVD